MMKKYYILILLMFSFVKSSMAQDLPLPTGKYRIGHHKFEWIDTSRTEILSADKSKRMIVAEVWYPAQNSTNILTEYLDTNAISHAFGVRGLRSLLGPQGALLIRSGAVHTHASEDANFATRIK